MAEQLRKASEVRDQLTAAIEEHGDRDLLVDVGLLYRVGEIGLCDCADAIAISLHPAVVEE